MTLSHMKSYEITVPSFWLLQNMDMNIREPTNKLELAVNQTGGINQKQMGIYPTNNGI